MRRLAIAALSAAMCAECLSAIVTERNDPYEDVGCLPPPAYTFVGTASYPGIDSCWIPYGTYTGGTGGTEYTRVTSKLMGVVASALGGLAEREYATGAYAGHHQYLMRPLGLPDRYQWWYDGGEYLASVTNLSIRLADQLNLSLMRLSGPDSTGTNYYEVMGGGNCLEPRLLAAATRFGSRSLDALTGNALPPVSTSWSSALPYSASDAELWKNVYPTYGNCTSDVHFLECWSGQRYLPYGWNMGSDADVWGHDLTQAYTDLQDALYYIPLDFTIEDVLSYDTGLQYDPQGQDDYAHWTNGSTRLDRKRLGIICQLERQMDTTYESLAVTDELPLWHMTTYHGMSYRSTPIVIPLPAPTHPGQEVPISRLFGSASWDFESEDYSASTNNSLWSTPTCRTPAPTVGMFASFLGATPTSSDVVLDRDVAEAMISDLSSQLENSTDGVMSHVEFEGMWGALTGGMTLDFLCTNSSCRGVVALPSNTVEVTSSTGAHATTWRDEPIVSRTWYLAYNNQEWWYFYPQSLPDGIARLVYGSKAGDRSEITVRTGSYDVLKGSISAPQITFTAVGGGSVRDGMWHLSGIEGLPADSQCHRNVEDPTLITWKWEGSNAEVRYNGANYLFYFKGDMGEYSIEVGTYVDASSVESSPGFSCTSRSFAAKWSTSSYQEEMDITSTNTFIWSGVPVVYEGANVTNDAYASMVKNASATFTFAHAGNRDDIISSFNPSYYSLGWDRIQSLRRSELELMISARGEHSQSEDTSPSQDGNFTWEAIVDSGRAYRTFRMRNGTAETSLQSANYARYNLLAGLSAECKRECRDRGGIPIGAIEDFGKITREERESFFSVLGDAMVSGHFLIVGSEDFLIKADVHKSGSVYEVDNIITPDFSNPRGVTIGSCGWTLSIDYDASSVTNRYRSVRADGYQAPVTKTLWKFKNLRDPNL